jgi:DNA modification methylase
MAAWRAAGFRIAGHIVFRKKYASSVRYMRYEHEQAYLLTKGDPSPPTSPISDVMDWTYTGNRLHPTQKPIEALEPLIAAFCEPSGLVLDPFCGFVVHGPQGAPAGTSSALSWTEVIF